MLSGLTSPLDRFLSRLLLRTTLEDAEKRAILTLPVQAQEIRAGYSLTEPGDGAGSACLVVDGIVGSTERTRHGARQIIAVHIDGDMANLSSVVQSVAACGLEALTASVVAHVPRAALRNLIASYPMIAEAFWRDNVVDAGVMAVRMTNIGRKNARGRLAHFFCEMACRYDRSAQLHDHSYVLPMTQEHLADTTGMTPVHFNRSLSALREEGIVKMRHKVVEILDWKALAAVGEFDPRYLGFPHPAVVKTAESPPSRAWAVLQ